MVASLILYQQQEGENLGRGVLGRQGSPTAMSPFFGHDAPLEKSDFHTMLAHTRCKSRRAGRHEPRTFTHNQRCSFHILGPLSHPDAHAAQRAWKRKAASAEMHFTLLWERVTGLSSNTLGLCQVTHTHTHTR